MASLSDYIAGLQKAQASSNTYTTIGDAILSANVNQPITAGSATTNFATNLLKGLLGGGLEAYGAVENKRYTQGIQDVFLPALVGKVPSPSDNLSESDIGELKRSADIFKAIQSQDRLSLFNDLQTKALGAGMAKKAEVLGDLNAKKDFYGSDILDPSSPQYVEQKRIRDEEDAARTEIPKLPAVTAYNLRKTALSQLDSLKDDNTGTSDIPFTTLFLQGLDGSTVREGEYLRVQGANPILQKYAAVIEGKLNGTSGLTTELKNQMYNELLSTAPGLLEAAKEQSAPRYGIATSRGGQPSNSLPFDPTGSDLPTPKVPTMDLETLAKQYPPTEQGRADFKAKAVELGLDK